MKILVLLSLATLACSLRLPVNHPVYVVELLREKTLADDFRDLNALIPEDKLEGLIRRYLLGDEEFQRIIRYFGSPEVNRAIELIRSQPEIREFNQWLDQELERRLFDSLSNEDSLEGWFVIYKRALSGLSTTTLGGWKGFMEEYLKIYPRGEIKNLIRDKVAANGKFAEFWGRISALRPVYERVMRQPELRKVIDKLRELGVDIIQLDRLIRDGFDWRAAGEIEGNNLGKLPAEKPKTPALIKPIA